MMKAIHREIGSYFWLEGTETLADDLLPAEWLPHSGDCVYTFSGRVAIEYAINDIMKTHDVKSVYMPAYCCVSMVQPFLDKNIKVDFYDIEYDGEIHYKVDTNKRCSIFFTMTYFGLGICHVDEITEEFKKRGIPVIEDITHSLLCNNPLSARADYGVASLRKWLAIPTGGYLIKQVGKLLSKPSLSGEQAVQSKIKAMHGKYDYLINGVGTKEKFLKGYANFENGLIRFDRKLQVDLLSAGILNKIDIEAVINQRRKNAKVLYDGLRGISNLQFLEPNPDWGEHTPLFVPILLETEKRDELHQYLIDNGVYCPIHWPEVIGTKIGIRANELSLICDYRYDEDDMNFVVNLIKTWVN